MQTYRRAAGGKSLGVSVPDAVNAGYSDALHAAWIAKKPRLTLPLRAESLDKILIPRQIAYGGFSAYGVFCGCLGYQSFESFAGNGDERTDHIPIYALAT